MNDCAACWYSEHTNEHGVQRLMCRVLLPPWLPKPTGLREVERHDFCDLWKPRSER